MAAKDPEVIDIPEEAGDGHDWQDVGPVNMKEAAATKKKLMTYQDHVIDAHR